MKKTLSIAIILIFAFTMVMGSFCTVSAATAPTKMTLSATSKTLDINGSYTIKVKTVTPKAASKAVTFKSSSKKVATVSSKGVVKAVGKGTATITVTSKYNKKLVKKVKITVTGTYKANKTSENYPVAGKTFTDKVNVKGKNGTVPFQSCSFEKNIVNKGDMGCTVQLMMPKLGDDTELVIDNAIESTSVWDPWPKFMVILPEGTVKARATDTATGSVILPLFSEDKSEKIIFNDKEYSIKDIENIITDGDVAEVDMSRADEVTVLNVFQMLENGAPVVHCWGVISNLG